jgi:hypothetical protein
MWEIVILHGAGGAATSVRLAAPRAGRLARLRSLTRGLRWRPCGAGESAMWGAFESPPADWRSGLAPRRDATALRSVDCPDLESRARVARAPPRKQRHGTAEPARDDKRVPVGLHRSQSPAVFNFLV